MTILLFPGRHLLQTAFQEQYLRSIVQNPLDGAEFLPGLPCRVISPVDTQIEAIVFAITSANHQFTRYNPIPFYLRAIGVDRFAAALASEFKIAYRIFGIPHYVPTPHFASILLKEIAEQTEEELDLTPENTVVLTSTMAVATMFQKLGFAILPAELAQNSRVSTPQQLLAAIMAQGEGWRDLPDLRNQISPTTAALWRNFPEITHRAFRLWNDPLLNDEASLTATRNYSTYAQAMSNDAVIDLKYGDIKPYILPGRVVDEGCADGALLIRIAKDFPDSDLIGIELTGELLARCIERQRAGEFGDTFVHFHQRNLTSPIFHPGTIHTTICNSTVHELWSYNQRAGTVLSYLREKFQQLAPGGRLLIRDVIGPEQGEKPIYLWLCDTDGESWDSGQHNSDVAQLSTHARFFRFAQDFLPQRRQPSQPSPVPFSVETLNGKNFIKTTLRLATEFLTKKDYTVNWASEMHEEFAFWSIADWKRSLAEIGFVVNSQSHLYTNEWIVENRWRGKAEIFERRADEQGDELALLPYPPTTVIVIADKPASEAFLG